MPVAILQDPPALTVYKELSAMYLQNKYSHCYYNIIANAQSRTFVPDIVEKHHILPKSLGGTNDKSNLVALTPREHYICHLLLTKMYEGKEKQKMIYAFWAIMNLCNQYQVRKVTKGRLYESLRQQYIQLQKNTAGANHHLKGRKTGRTKETFTDEWRANISASKKGMPTWNKGITHSDKTKALQSKLAKNRPKQECPHCKKIIAGPSNFTRWHNDNCKLKF